MYMVSAYAYGPRPSETIEALREHVQELFEPVFRVRVPHRRYKGIFIEKVVRPVGHYFFMSEDAFDILPHLRTLPGVASNFRVLTDPISRMPSRVPTSQVKRFRDALSESALSDDNPGAPPYPYRVGERVRFIQGAFSGFIGEVLGFKGNHLRVALESVSVGEVATSANMLEAA